MGLPADHPVAVEGAAYPLREARPAQRIRGAFVAPLAGARPVYWIYPIACLTGRMAAILSRFGLADHPVTRGARATLLHLYRPGQGFDCGVLDRSPLPACVMTSPESLKSLLSVPPAERTAAEDRMLADGLQVLQDLELSRYVPARSRAFAAATKGRPLDEVRSAKAAWIREGRLEERVEKSGWQHFSFPLGYNADLLEALWVLAAAGVRRNPVIDRGLAHLLSKRTRTGRWKRAGGLPAGADGAVTVTGPGGYAHAVSATTTPAGLALGTYSVTAAPATNGDPIVPTMFDGSATSSTLNVQENTTASATVTYASRPGSGHLWLPIWPSTGTGQVASMPSGSLASSGTFSADVTLTSASDEGEAVVFDKAGNMWVSDWTGHIYRYDVAQLYGSGTMTPALTIDATAYGSVSGLAFDSAGNLWAAAYNASQVLAYTPAQITTGGTLTPSVVIDADGTPSLAGPVALAFDASGDLWVANLKSDTVVRYDASQLTASGTPTPSATIGSGSFAVGGGPWSLAFDASGALWVTGSYAQDLRRFTDLDALSGTVTPTPDTVITGLRAGDMYQMAFSPAPTDLPIHTP